MVLIKFENGEIFENAFSEKQLANDFIDRMVAEIVDRIEAPEDDEPKPSAYLMRRWYKWQSAEVITIWSRVVTDENFDDYIKREVTEIDHWNW